MKYSNIFKATTKASKPSAFDTYLALKYLYTADEAKLKEVGWENIRTKSTTTGEEFVTLLMRYFPKEDKADVAHYVSSHWDLLTGCGRDMTTAMRLAISHFNTKNAAVCI